jgi:hypothetical protein
MVEPTYQGRTLAEWERLRDKAIRWNDLFCELLCDAHIRLMREGRTDATIAKAETAAPEVQS